MVKKLKNKCNIYSYVSRLVCCGQLVCREASLGVPQSVMTNKQILASVECATAIVIWNESDMKLKRSDDADPERQTTNK